MIKSNPEECEACCCVDMGSIIDNNECVAHIEQAYSSEDEARASLEKLINQAREVESDPCKIESKIEIVEQGVVLKASFDFACQAETLIFQLALR